VRTYGEVIDVRTTGNGAQDGLRDGAHPADGAPAQFVWRGRLYLVRDVLAHWVELGTWWTLPRRAAVPQGVGVPGSPPGSRTTAASPDDEPPARSVAADVGAVEREVWRVEAAAGRTATCGVYDLVRDVPAVDPRAPLDAHPPRWRLARALD
jgi:hypothetical protein